MKTSSFWLGDLTVTEAKTGTGWALSRTKERSDKLELVLQQTAVGRPHTEDRTCWQATIGKRMNVPQMFHRNSTAEYI